MLSILIFLFMVGLLVSNKLPMATSAILGCTLMVILGVCDFKTAFAPFASSTVILTVGVMIIGAAMSETGLAALIGKKIVELSKGSERKLIFGAYFAAAFMSMFLTNSAVLAIFIPIMMGLSTSDGRIQTKNLIMPIAIACVLGGGSTLAGSTQQLVAQGFLEDLNIRTFSMFDLTPVGFTIVIVGCIYCLLIGYPRGKKIWGSESVSAMAWEAQGPREYDRKKIICMIAIFLFTIVFYITSWLPLAITSTLGALLCIATGCITQENAIKGVNWNVVGRLGGCLGAAKALEIGGGIQIISEFFGQLIGSDISPYALFVAVIIITQLISRFVSASVALTIVLPIFISVVHPLGLNTFTYVLGATLASPVVLSTPLASSTLGFAMSAGYQFRDYFKYSFFLDILGAITICVLVPLFYGLKM